MSHRSVIIIGSGPAGYTAAIYAARGGLRPLMFAGYAWGGQLMTTTDVENYPGFPKGILGPELMRLFREQAERFGTEVVDRDVTRVRFASQPFEIWVEQERYTADGVIVSTGASPKILGVSGEQTLWGRGVSTCATCDGAFFKDRVVAVVGGGDTAAEEALYLSRLCKHVILVHRREEFRASHIMVQRMKSNEKISFLLNYAVHEIQGKDTVESLLLKSTSGKEDKKIAVDGVFVAIGYLPNTHIFAGQLDLHDTGYLNVKPGTTETSVPGVFAAGDVQDHMYRQAVTAAGSGCMAAIALERYLQHRGHAPSS